MNLTLSDLRALPMASALVGVDGHIVVNTPEWRGDGPGAASYPVRRSRLVVCVEPAAPDCTALLEQLLHELDRAASAAPPPRSLQVRMLAASLRLVAGRSVSLQDAVPAAEVLELARAGIEARTGLDVRIAQPGDGAVRGGEAAALVLVQLAVNAERHGGAAAVTLNHDRDLFSAAWRGELGGRVTTARSRQDRERWGLGFARIAADAIGGVLHAPRAAGDAVVAALEVGVPRLSLPLAAIRDQRVLRATRAWDDETGALPGTAITADRRMLEAAVAAAAAPGQIARSGSLAARLSGDALWFAVPPDDVADRARDVIDGLTHEQALVDGVAEPLRSRINGMAQLLAHALGAPLQRVPAAAWTRRMRTLAEQFALTMPVPELAGAGATDPAVSVLLAAEAGERFELEGGSLWLRLRRDRSDGPLARALLSGDRERIRLG